MALALADVTYHLAPDRNTLRRLRDVARGAAPADLVISGGALANVFTGELQEGWGLAVAAGRVAFVGPDAEVHARVGEGNGRVDLAGDVVAPGLIEGHTHLTRVRVSDFADAQVCAGVTTTVVESMEYAAILGPESLRLFLAEAAQTAGRLLYTISGLIMIDPEQSSRLNADDWIQLLDSPGVVGVGEIYWADLLRGHERSERLIEAALARGLAVSGHGAGARPAGINAMAASGVGSDHEGIDADDLLQRLRVGLHALARHGATRQDLPAIAHLWQRGAIDLSRLGLVTDGVEPSDLAEGRSLNIVVAKAVELGLPPVSALRLASRNVAEHFGLGRWLGGLGAGMLADVVVLPRAGGSIGFQPRLVLVSGRRPEPSPPSRYPDWLSQTTRLGVLPAALLERPPSGCWRAMELQTSTVTREVESDGRSDLLCLCLGRDGSGRGFRGLLRGFGLRTAAVAISSPWELNAALIVGEAPTEMALAARRLEELGGGVVVTREGCVEAEYAAPVAGLYSVKPLNEVVSEVAAVNCAMRTLGCTSPNPILTLETLTTGAIPFLRIFPGGYRRLRDGAILGLEWESTVSV
ncbi:MAG: adenine deaminase C-terminal domain-containing protein [Candidatus Dormibacter sp.]